MKKNLLLILCVLNLTGCISPIIAGGAGIGAGLVAAKDNTLTEAVDDARISSAIKASFIKKGFKALYTKISVNVVDGRVLYTGKVSSDQDIITAVDIAWDQKGVKEVMNELKVDDKSSYFDTAEYARDSWITSRIKTKTITEKGVKFINYNIITSGGVVYVLGIAKSQEELDKVAEIASEIHGVEKVVVHAKIMTSDREKEDL
jgi:osmotically-inducible protein OsmY